MENGQFWTKTMDYPLWKDLDFSTFSTSCYYSLQRRFFALEYHKTNFAGLHILKKKRWKMANFGPKPWTIPFGKI